ncbi:MAG: hypothetical protein AAB225_12090 [Acidobacteriota bacterium]
MSDGPAINRREFLKRTGAASAVAGQAAAGKEVAIMVDPSDPVAAAAPARWAAKELEEALTAAGCTVSVRRRIGDAPPGALCILAAGRRAPLAREALKAAGVSVPDTAESLALAPSKAGGKPVLLACGADPRGLSYALLELADRVRHGHEPLAALEARKPIVERPANTVRSVARLFSSDVEDKPWYNDREMWPRYLTMLAAQRFNRFHLSFGIGYDFLRNVTDGYFLFAYPFLLSVPGYSVRVPQLADAERDRNLEMLKYISEQTVARGLEFQLGIWMHGYQWIDSPRPNYSIEGLTRQTHGPYCRDAVRALLRACPAITGVTFRVHGESGVEEGSYDFWKTVFEGVATCGRKVEIDMHSKGMDQTMLDLGVATGMPLKVSPKYWAEHLGMPYHQADIRELERPWPGREATGLMKLSAGSRSFTRYGYADLLREDRRWGVLHRIWPGTQRLLLWGDPVMAAAYGRAFSFCGSDGVEIMEPLSFKGRRGSGIAGDRCAYADASLRPRWDWEKYVYSFRVWGRLLYSPDAEPDVWRRYLRKQFQAGAPDAEAALANASRILPVVTTAHGASAGNNTYWPEVYTNQPIVDPNRRHPYGDSPSPRVFGNVSPLDPQLFSRINDFADELLKGERSGKYSPVEVAQWLEDWANAAANHLARAEAQAAGKGSPEFRRLAIDVAIQAGLGRFFGAKLRSGVLYAIYERSGDRTALAEALKAYRNARAAWVELANRAKDVYKPDITIGERPHLRGHWLDRLPAIDEDIADMAERLERAKPGEAQQERVRLVIKEAWGRPRRGSLSCRHTPPARFRPGEPLAVELSLEKGRRATAVRLHYRRVNQAERWRAEQMEARGNGYRAVIPAEYTASPFPLQYFFELREAPDAARLWPGCGADLSNQPYFVVRQR